MKVYVCTDTKGTCLGTYTHPTTAQESFRRSYLKRGLIDFLTDTERLTLTLVLYDNKIVGYITLSRVTLRPTPF